VRLVACGRIRANVHDVACVAQELEGGDTSAFEALVTMTPKALNLRPFTRNTRPKSLMNPEPKP